MTETQILLLAILSLTVAAFFSGRWRHDLVAVAALLACVVVGLVPAGQAFSGFGHPAVITVASVLVLSRALQLSGLVEALTDRVMPEAAGALTTVALLTALGAALSSFMNNVGAMALLMPVAVQLAARHELPPGKVLMPLAFGTILGGMTTLIGTPPNLIVSGFRESAGGASFGMFDFTPVGLGVALAGVAFVALLSRFLVPTRERGGTTGFDTGSYLVEARVDADGRAVGMTLGEVERSLEEVDAQVVSLVRNDVRLSAPSLARRLRAGDILVIEAEPETLASALESLGLKIGDSAADDEDHRPDSPGADAQPAPAEAGGAESAEPVMQELVVKPGAVLAGRTAHEVRLRARYGLTLLALARQGRRSIKSLRTTRLRAGDVLLVSGEPDALAGFAAQFGCLPLARRTIRLPGQRQAWLAGGAMVLAIAGAAFGLLPAAVSFVAAILALLLARVLPLRETYESIDWPIIVLLAALIPVAGAMTSSGAADLLATWLLESLAPDQPVLALAVLLVVSMTVSDFMNNAATAAVMCPIALSTADQLGVHADPFLMAVAVGASCAFLTPIGHQNNTLILGPGGFSFTDYWRLGLPLEILVVAVSLPLLLWVWPL